MKKRPYKNAVRTREKIRTATIQLWKETKGIEGITVTAICQKAEVTRGTFYNHYRNVADVIKDIENNLLDQLSNLLKSTQIQDEKGRKAFFDTLGSFFEKNRDIGQAVAWFLPLDIYREFKARLDSVIRAEITERYPKLASNPMLSTEVLLLTNGLAGTYVDYLLQDETALSLSGIADAGTDLLNRLSLIEK